MNQTQLIEVIEEAFAAIPEIGDFERMPDEDNVIGVTTIDGNVFFVRVEPG